MTTMEAMGTRLGVGADPGHEFASVVARDGDRLVRARVFVASKELSVLTLANQADRRRAWAELVLGVVADFIADLAEVAGLTSTEPAFLVEHGMVALGVEDVVRPKSRRRGDPSGAAPHQINPEALLGTAWLGGAVTGRYPGAVIVAPSGNGSNPELCYPEGIRKGRRNLGGPPEHARSAWDVAGAALWHARTANGRNPTHA